MSLQSPEFKFITEDRLQEWKTSTSAANSKLQDSVPMPRFIYELCWAMVRGDLPLQKCRAALESTPFTGEQQSGEMGSVFADTIAHMGQDLTLTGEYHTRLVKMASLHQ